MQKIPVHRPVIKNAVLFSWHHPKLWILGILSAVLFSGGTVDFVYRFWHSISQKVSALSNLQKADLNVLFILQVFKFPWFGGDFLGAPFLNSFLIVGAFFIFIFSCIAQGLLISFFQKSETRGTLRIHLQNIFQQIPSIIAINLFTFFIFWISCIGMTLPMNLVLCDDCPLFFLQYLFAFLFFFMIIMIVSVLHLFTLNSVLFVKKGFLHGFLCGCRRIKKYWLLILETIFFQSILQLFFSVVALVFGIFLSIPAIALLTYAFLEKNAFALKIGSFYITFILIAIFVLTMGFLTVFQYAIWSFMYHAMTINFLIPKLKRISRIFNLSI